MNTELISNLYDKYDIAHLTYGKVNDKLGDVYEELCILILNNKDFLYALKSGDAIDCIEFDIFRILLTKAKIPYISEIDSIIATNNVPHRDTHGNAKTDVIATIKYMDGNEILLPISIKQSYAPKVAVAEFDVDTICNEAKIDDVRIKSLMNKFQTARSAKGLSNCEKSELRNLLKPYARNLVRWAITGSADVEPSDVVFPRILVKFKTIKPKDRYNAEVSKGELHYLSHAVYTIDEYIDLTMYDKKGKAKSGGFGTGMAWTYASHAGGRKIQFKA